MSTIRLFTTTFLAGLLACASLAANAGPTVLPHITLNFGAPFGAGGMVVGPHSYGYDHNAEEALLSRPSLTGGQGFDFGVLNTATTDLRIRQLTLNFHFDGLVQILPQTRPEYAGFAAWTAPSGFVNGNSDIVLSWQPGGAYLGDLVPDFNTLGFPLAPAYGKLTIDTGLTTLADQNTFANDGNLTTAIATATPEPGSFALLGSLLAAASVGYRAYRRRRKA